MEYGWNGQAAEQSFWEQPEPQIMRPHGYETNGARVLAVEDEADNRMEYGWNGQAAEQSFWEQPEPQIMRPHGYGTNGARVLAVEDEADNHIAVVLSHLESFKSNLARHPDRMRICDGYKYCISNCYSLPEIINYMTANYDEPEATVRSFCKSLIGTTPEGLAYTRASAKRAKARQRR